ncbi:MFS transporter [Rhodococcus artemisiae]|uniref:MFS transporter n=1 Tax=Rhodococcus artemisiae TaxID=714159 RepID=A0ABU7LBJ6_9NOCA|nr:MFS transporter [Rhodococcus artemisiae]MEE2058287.1 MFS transporter [Rhodococcus artemisiae]
MTLALRRAPARRRAPEVVVCAAAGFTTLLDSSVLNIGLPALRSALDAEGAEVQWIFAAYSLTFGLALVPAGRLGDVYGRRRLLLAGMLLFATMGVCSAVAPGPWTVIVARFGQGLGAGMISAQVLGIIAERFTGSDRAKALAAYSTAGGLAGLCGPLTGGVILSIAPDAVGWRLLLLLNVPFAVLTLLLTVRYLEPDHRESGTRTGIDIGGLFLLAVITALLMFPVVADVPPQVVGSSIVGAGLAIAGFFWWEKRFATRFGNPVLIPALTRSGGYLLGTLVAMFWFGAVVSLNAVVGLYLIEGLGYPALYAAVVMSAGSLAMAVASSGGWRIVARVGRGAVAVAVLVELAVIGGYIGAAQLAAPIAVFVALAVVSGLTGGMVDAPNRVLTLESSPPGGHGVAAGFLQLSQRLSATVTIAAVSGLYLSALSTDPADFAGAATAGLIVCGVMIALSLVLAVADGRRRAASSS